MTTPVWAISMVKDEADVIGYTLRHLIANGVDGIVIADNMSSDNTRKILEDVKQSAKIPVVIIDDNDPAYYQSFKLSELMRQAIKLSGSAAPYIIPFDADELLHTVYPLHAKFASYLRYTLQDVIRVPMINYFSCVNDLDSLNPFERISHRHVQENSLSKVVFRANLSMRIMQGSHDVCSSNGGVYAGKISDLFRIAHFPYRSAEHFCNPPEAPIWMADLSFKSIGSIKIGDRVMGSARIDGVYRSVLVPSTVSAIYRRESPIVRVGFESGRFLRCSPDHLWRQHFYSSGEVVKGARGKKRVDGKGWDDVRVFGSDGTYLPAKVGRSLSHIINPTQPVKSEDEWLAGWLAGIFDGEGSSDSYTIQIAQSLKANEGTYRKISTALKHFGFDFSERHDRMCIRGGRQAYVDFHNITRPTRRVTTLRDPSKQASRRLRNLIPESFGFRAGEGDRIVSVEPDGFGEVIGMTTDTGNYVAWGYASKNCRKAINGGLAYRAAALPEEQGAHWRAYYAAYERGGEAALVDWFERYFYFREDRLSELIHDPAPCEG